MRDELRAAIDGRFPGDNTELIDELVGIFEHTPQPPMDLLIELDEGEIKSVTSNQNTTVNAYVTEGDDDVTWVHQFDVDYNAQLVSDFVGSLMEITVIPIPVDEYDWKQLPCEYKYDAHPKLAAFYIVQQGGNLVFCARYEDSTMEVFETELGTPAEEYPGVFAGLVRRVDHIDSLGHKIIVSVLLPSSFGDIREELEYGEVLGYRVGGTEPERGRGPND